MSLRDLPTELLDQTFRYLDPSSLRSLSLVDKTCRSATVAVLFEAVSIEPQQAPQLCQLMQKNGYAKHIRTLEIRSGLPSTIRYDQETFPQSVFLAQYKADAQHPRESYAQDVSWRSVVVLLETLPTLKDLIWTCLQHFPPSLLHCLHETKHLTPCRLHLRTFKLRSLATRSEETVDPHELALVQSSNLYSIWLNYDVAESWTNRPRLPEAVSRTVRGLAPNLSEVRLWENWVPKPAYGEYSRLTRTVESALPLTSNGKGHLRTLRFSGPGQNLTEAAIDEWDKCTEFDGLERLIVDYVVRTQTLARIAACRFSSLTAVRLWVSLDPNSRDWQGTPIDDSSKLVQDFLCNITPLKELKLSGEMAHYSLYEVIQHHGRALRALDLQPGWGLSRLSFLPEEVSWIADHCFSLEELRLTMQRCKGDNAEVAAYSSIGKIRTLQSLALTLDASDHRSLRRLPGETGEFTSKSKTHFDDFARENADIKDLRVSRYPRKGHIMDTFINAALDEQLARSIYAKLTENRSAGAFILDPVELQSDGCGDFGVLGPPPVMAVVANEIQNRWLFRRRYGFGAQSGGLEVSKLEHTKHLHAGDGEEAGSKDELHAGIEPIFRRLWPPKGDDSHWRSDWHSFELSK